MVTVRRRLDETRSFTTFYPGGPVFFDQDGFQFNAHGLQVDENGHWPARGNGEPSIPTSTPSPRPPKESGGILPESQEDEETMKLPHLRRRYFEVTGRNLRIGFTRAQVLAKIQEARAALATPPVEEPAHDVEA